MVSRDCVSREGVLMQIEMPLRDRAHRRRRTAARRRAAELGMGRCSAVGCGADATKYVLSGLNLPEGGYCEACVQRALADLRREVADDE